MLNIQHLLSIRSNNQNPKASESNTQVQSGQYQPFLLGSPRCVHLPRSSLVLFDQHTQGGLWHHTFDRGTTELYMIYMTHCKRLFQQFFETELFTITMLNEKNESMTMVDYNITQLRIDPDYIFYYMHWLGNKIITSSIYQTSSKQQTSYFGFP